MTPEQLALLQAGAEEVYDPTLRARVLAGELPPEALNPRGATPIRPRGVRPTTGEFVSEFKEGVKQKLSGAKDTLKGVQARYPNAGRYGVAALGAASLIPGVTTALSELEAGRPTGAVGALAPGLLSAAGTGLAMAPHPLAKAAGFGLMGLGAILPGASAQGAEAVRQSVTGKPTKGKEAEFSTQLAMRGQLAEQDLTTLDRQLGVHLGYMRDLNRDASNQAFLDLQRMNPLIQQMKNADLVRQQALLNTQGNIQANLGVLATAGALAQGAQAEMGATTRTALTSNPYAGSTLQAPQIRFG
jgi:hypothetical protein